MDQTCGDDLDSKGGTNVTRPWMDAKRTPSLMGHYVGSIGQRLPEAASELPSAQQPTARDQAEVAARLAETLPAGLL
jgi:hypothetical protein